MDIKRTLLESGVTLSEFATLCGVSKNMIHKWAKGSNPHSLRAPKVERLLLALDRAVIEGLLPIGKDAPPRLQVIQEAVIEMLKHEV